MDILCELYKTNLALSKAEVLTLAKKKSGILSSNLLEIKNVSIQTLNTIQQRVAYTRAVYQTLFKTTPKQFESKLKSFSWNKHYKKDFSVRIESKKKTLSEKQIAKYIWHSVKKPKVKLKNSETPFVFFQEKDQIICCKELFHIKQGFEARKSHLRPRPTPISLHPRLARSMVNLTGAKKNRSYLRPTLRLSRNTHRSRACRT